MRLLVTPEGEDNRSLIKYFIFAEVHNALFGFVCTIADFLSDYIMIIITINHHHDDKAETLTIVYRTKASETALKKLVNNTIKPLIFLWQF